MAKSSNVMKFVCPSCKRVFKRDRRAYLFETFLTKAGNYKSFCAVASKTTYCKPVQGGRLNG